MYFFTKINPSEFKIEFSKKISRQGISQVGQKYLATESVDGGYLVVFDSKTPAGTVCKTIEHQIEDKTITSFIIGIGYRES